MSFLFVPFFIAGALGFLNDYELARQREANLRNAALAEKNAQFEVGQAVIGRVFRYSSSIKPNMQDINQTVAVLRNLFQNDLIDITKATAIAQEIVINLKTMSTNNKFVTKEFTMVLNAGNCSVIAYTIRADISNHIIHISGGAMSVTVSYKLGQPTRGLTNHETEILRKVLVDKVDLESKLLLA